MKRYNVVRDLDPDALMRQEESVSGRYVLAADHDAEVSRLRGLLRQVGNLTVRATVIVIDAELKEAAP